MTAEEARVHQLLEAITAAGGWVKLDNGSLDCYLPRKRKKAFVAELRKHQAAVRYLLLKPEVPVLIPAACRCDEKPYPHFRHDTPLWPLGQTRFVQGDLEQLKQALTACRATGEEWTMRDLVEQLERAGAKIDTEEPRWVGGG